jgi:hypothetical protein
MSPTLRIERRAQLIAELRELDRQDALEHTRRRSVPCASQGVASGVGREQAPQRETINILGAAWEVQCG